MRRLVPLALLAACAGLDTPPVTPDARDPACLDEEERIRACTVPIEARVVDFVTLLPYSGRPAVAQTTAWDVPGFFPVGCTPLFEGAADADGALVLPQASCASIVYPPIVLLTVEGGSPEPRAPTAWDRRLVCNASGVCDAVVADIAAPSRERVDAWRSVLAAGGMPNAGTGGLAVFQYLDAGGAPAAGVVPTSITGVPFPPGTRVRFLADDRQTLLPVETGVTGASGFAMGVDLYSVGGTRDADHWSPSGLLVAPGWVFVESLDQE